MFEKTKSLSKKFLLGNLNKMKDMSIKIGMGNMRRDQNMMRFFPNGFVKRDPLGKYFWPLISVVLREQFQEIYERQPEIVKRRIRKPTFIMRLPEHLEQLHATKDENIHLFLALKKTGVEKNINYLRKSTRDIEGVRKGQINRYFQV